MDKNGLALVASLSYFQDETIVRTLRESIARNLLL